MLLDLSSLDAAIAQVEEALAFTRSDLALQNERVAFQFRASSIQAFEYTYELSYKMLLRYLELTEASDLSFATMSFQQIIRLGYERGLLQSELRIWMQFRKNRGSTSHTYNHEKAQEVFLAIPEFLTEATYLFSEIQRRQLRSNG